MSIIQIVFNAYMKPLYNIMAHIGQFRH